MKKILVPLLLALLVLPSMAQARTLDMLSAHYRDVIRSGWPSLPLRADQEQWLADRSAAVLQDCLLAGDSVSHCRKQVTEALAEILGVPPERPLSPLDYADFQLPDGQ